MELAYNSTPRFTRWLISNGLLQSRFVVIDAGVQGGISPRWTHFGDALEVHGFDALSEAILPLQASPLANHHFYALALGDEDGTRDFDVRAEGTASSFYEQVSRRFDFDPSVFATVNRRTVSIRRLDSLMAEGVLPRADYLKIDCEGAEVEILRGARDLLRHGVAAVELETNFDAKPDFQAVHFIAAYSLLAPLGFVVLNLNFNRIPCASFARRARELGLATSGLCFSARPATYNVLFYRDGANSEQPPTSDEILKRAAILEIYGMADWAYDVLTSNRHVFRDDFPLQHAADLLIVARSAEVGAGADVPKRTRTSPWRSRVLRLLPFRKHGKLSASADRG